MGLSMTQTIAALYVDPNGVYANLPGVEVWDEARDARTYSGPWPVVAHPPCGKWCLLAPLNASQYPGFVIGDDGGAFAGALHAVRTWGGVLEHPASTLAWKHHALPQPTRGMWVRSLLDEGWVTEISQAAYGAPVRKRTWLYFVGADPPSMRWNEPDVASIVSDLGPGNSRRRGADWKPGVQYAAASATPPAFRDVLLHMAGSANRRYAA
jgi:hypothetical protein